MSVELGLIYTDILHALEHHEEEIIQGKRARMFSELQLEYLIKLVKEKLLDIRDTHGV
jgi:hypothetical protein